MSEVNYKNIKFTLAFKECHPILPASFWATEIFLENYIKISGTDVGFLYQIINSELIGYMESGASAKLFDSLKDQISKDWIAKELELFDKLLLELKVVIESIRYKKLNRNNLVVVFESILEISGKLYPYSNIFYLLSEEIEKRIPQDQLKDIKPIKETFLTKYSKELERLADKLQEGFGLIDQPKLEDLYKNNGGVSKMIDDLQAEYFCLTSFNVGIRTPESFFPEIISQIKKGNIKKEFDSPDESDDLYILRTMIYFKDQLSTFVVPYVTFSLTKQLEDVSYLLELSREDLDFLLITELIENLKQPKNLNELIKNRKQAVLFFHEAFRDNVVYEGINAKSEIDMINFEKQSVDFVNTDSITGKTGSAGAATGKVQILLNSSEIKDFEEGNVVVAVYTAPEFVPAMKKAKAIVTDTGGITCHAAIVSRELGIPCVVGTKIATKVLKDGDIVEVDAEKGVVRIIKKA